MKIRIIRGRKGKAICKGFFPRAGVRVKPSDVYECENEEHLKACLETGLVEQVFEEDATEPVIEDDDADRETASVR